MTNGNDNDKFISIQIQNLIKSLIWVQSRFQAWTGPQLKFKLYQIQFPPTGPTVDYCSISKSGIWTLDFHVRLRYLPTYIHIPDSRSPHQPIPRIDSESESESILNTQHLQGRMQQSRWRFPTFTAHLVLTYFLMHRRPWVLVWSDGSDSQMSDVDKMLTCWIVDNVDVDLNMFFT